MPGVTSAETGCILADLGIKEDFRGVSSLGRSRVVVSLSGSVVVAVRLVGEEVTESKSSAAKTTSDNHELIHQRITPCHRHLRQVLENMVVDE
jgi:hypothetical protein